MSLNIFTLLNCRKNVASSGAKRKSKPSSYVRKFLFSSIASKRLSTPNKKKRGEKQQFERVGHKSFRESLGIAV